MHHVGSPCSSPCEPGLTWKCSQHHTRRMQIAETRQTAAPHNLVHVSYFRYRGIDVARYEPRLIRRGSTRTGASCATKKHGADGTATESPPSIQSRLWFFLRRPGGPAGRVWPRRCCNAVDVNYTTPELPAKRQIGVPLTSWEMLLRSAYCSEVCDGGASMASV